MGCNNFYRTKRTVIRITEMNLYLRKINKTIMQEKHYD